ncbi:glycosyltransferase family 2 protein [Clostridium perfringens]
MKSIKVILTCYNRKHKTINCIKSLVNGNPNVNFSFIIVDDNSNDGTIEALNELIYPITIINGNGSLFWSGGMRKGISYYLKNENSQYVLLVNDDVSFFERSIEKMLIREEETNAIIVGCTCDEKNNFTYGALKINHPIKKDIYYHVKPNDGDVECDTFNANCVLIKDNIFRKLGNFDYVYKHSLADLDYGLSISRKGYSIKSSLEYVGICFTNDIKGSWRDKSLGRIERIRKKEHVKGSPLREWFYFMKKNFGVLLAIRYSITPYLRIIFGK